MFEQLQNVKRPTKIALFQQFSESCWISRRTYVVGRENLKYGFDVVVGFHQRS